MDNLSPFAPNILECLGRIGVKYIHKKFSEVVDSDLISIDRVILSGRRKNSKENNAANSKIIKHCYENDIPLLGICYGAEIIALTLGGTIARMPRAVQSQITVSVIGDSPLTNGKKSVSVYESHGFCVARLPHDFKTLANSELCKHEIFSHIEKKIYGTQFHPEKSGPDGLEIISNFVST